MAGKNIQRLAKGNIINVTRSRRRQCYVCFKKFETEPQSQIKCCSDECKKQYEEIKKANRNEPYR